MTPTPLAASTPRLSAAPEPSKTDEIVPLPAPAGGESRPALVLEGPIEMEVAGPKVPPPTEDRVTATSGREG
ncbi:MAG TPA: hypothetical protein VE270_01750, partial [Thermoleophilaceae bacterium]|nr:hypothetical protein [Thermoleophilaceae bacterium]